MLGATVVVQSDGELAAVRRARPLARRPSAWHRADAAVGRADARQRDGVRDGQRPTILGVQDNNDALDRQKRRSFALSGRLTLTFDAKARCEPGSRADLT